MPLVGSIASFSTGTYSVSRTAAGSYVDGFYVDGGVSSFNIDASIQPVTGRETLAVPEGYRAEETRVVYTTTELRALTPTSIGDVITYKSEPWEVIKSEQWPDLAGSEFTRAYIARRPPGGGP